MELVTSTGGTTYRLHGATFQVSGPQHATLSSDTNPETSVLTASLAVGGYSVDLQDGWDLERQDGDHFVTVQATLLSSNPETFQIAAGGVTNLVYQFLTIGTVVTIGTGTLDISLQVITTAPDAGTDGVGGGPGGGGMSGSGGSLFAAPVFYETSVETNWVALGDMNSDRLTDVIAVCGEATTVLLNSGDGSLAFLGNFHNDFSFDPSTMALGDLDGDGKPDVVVSNATQSTVSVIFNISGTGPIQPTSFANGMFTSGMTLSTPNTTGQQATSLALGDVTGDGTLDLAVVDTFGGFSVYSNNGHGIFSFLGTTSTGAPEASSLIIADLDGNGHNDVAVAGPNTVVVFLNIGSTPMASPGRYSAPKSAVDLATADLDGDGQLDLVVVGSDGSVDVLLNAGQGTFRPPLTYSAHDTPVTVTLGDVNGDGRPDIAVANGGSLDVSILLNEGNGVFSTATDIPVPAPPTKVALGDLNGDGRAELVVAMDNGTRGIAVLLNIAR